MDKENKCSDKQRQIVSNKKEYKVYPPYFCSSCLQAEAGVATKFRQEKENGYVICEKREVLHHLQGAGGRALSFEHFMFNIFNS